jgi:hypothetical protein
LLVICELIRIGTTIRSGQERGLVMARNFTKTVGTSRIRFVLFDAELADGDVGPITQAIQNALRGPAPATIQRLPFPPKMHDTNGADAPEPDSEVDHEVEVVDATPEATRQGATRKPPPTPNVIDIEMNEGVSLASFAQGKDAKSHHKRFLIAAAWLKEHRNADTVSVDHIYTCYRSMSWPTGIPDFAQPLRDLKAKKYFTQPEKGLYAINHIGLDYVKRLGGE